MPAIAIVLALSALLFFPGFAQGQAVETGERIKQCGVCHGDSGNSQTRNVPSLAGQPEFFILNQLFLMREGVRPIEAMKPYVKDLKDSDIEALAKHFGALEPVRSNEEIDPALVKRGAELAAGLRCASCHLPGFTGRQQMPRLARQRIDYLIHSMREFRDNKRSGADTLMSNAVAGLSDADLTALAHYTASVEQ
jgi:cytochrome c553